MSHLSFNFERDLARLVLRDLRRNRLTQDFFRDVRDAAIGTKRRTSRAVVG
jgi:hypothetical protein